MKMFTVNIHVFLKLVILACPLCTKLVYSNCSPHGATTSFSFYQENVENECTAIGVSQPPSASTCQDVVMCDFDCDGLGHKFCVDGTCVCSPDPELCLPEYHKVLSTSGTFSCSENSSEYFYYGEIIVIGSTSHMNFRTREYGLSYDENIRIFDGSGVVVMGHNETTKIFYFYHHTNYVVSRYASDCSEGFASLSMYPFRTVGPNSTVSHQEEPELTSCQGFSSCPIICEDNEVECCIDKTCVCSPDPHICRHKLPIVETSNVYICNENEIFYYGEITFPGIVLDRAWPINSRQFFEEDTWIYRGSGIADLGTYEGSKIFYFRHVKFLKSVS